MSGYLRLNPLSVNGFFEYVLTDQTEFNTDASTVPIRDHDEGRRYDDRAQRARWFGQLLVRLNSRTLAREGDFFYVTNRPDGAQVPDEAKRMAGDIAWATSPGHQEHGDLLVMLQSFGTPKGNSAGWLQAADAIQRLG